MKKVSKVCIAGLIILVFSMSCLGCVKNKDTNKLFGSDFNISSGNGSKQPNEYTWEEFEMMDSDQKIEFQNRFDSFEAFEEWMQRVKASVTEENTELDLPWENGGKSPKEYTWEEFELLDGGEQIAFQKSFDSFEAFEEWMQSVNGTDTQEKTEQNLPWENGGKPPKEYTWEEFNELSGPQQIQFQKSFKDYKDFEKWMDKVLKAD